MKPTLKRPTAAPSPASNQKPKAKPSGSVRAQPKRRQTRRARKKKKGGPQPAGEENDGVMEVIDMTELDDDENAAEGEEAEVNGDPGPSTLQSRLYAMATEVTPARIPPEAPYTPTAFKPIKRSMATGRGRISISPAAAAVESVLTANSTGRPTADIVIDEVSSAQQEAGATHAPSEHFDPPGLFTTSLVPTSASAPEQSHFNGGAGATTSAPLALLLPEHVQLDDVIPQDEGHSAVSGAEDVSDPTMEGLHFLESDVAKGVTRYFDPDADGEPKGEEATFLATADQSKICTNCKKPGHKPRDCPHIVCTTCGEMDAHERRECPFGLTCFSCGLRGHRAQDCPTPSSKASRRNGCERCGNRDHKDNACPTLWRIYVYQTAAIRQSILSAKRAETGWAKEAVGGGSVDDWCYNCARTGHLGDDCSLRRGSLARLTTPSAFSAQISSSGPFARAGRRPGHGSAREPLTDTPVHQRFDDDDEVEGYEYDLPGVKQPFAGLQAGRKTREKARQKAKDIDAATSISDDDEYIDGGRSLRLPSGRGMAIRGRGGRGGMGTPKTPYSRTSRTAWPTEHGGGASAASSRHSGSFRPFSHSHLMSPLATSAPSSAPAKTQGIVFGKIAGLPDKPSEFSTQPHTPTAPSHGSGLVGTPTDTAKESVQPKRTGEWKNRASKALIERALGHASAPASRDRSPISVPSPLSQNGDASSPRKRRRRQEDPSDADFEAQWRQRGNGGGSVRDWGKEEDRIERQEKREGKETRGDGGSRYGVKGGINVRGASNARGGRGGAKGASRGGKAGESGNGSVGGTPRGGGQGPATPVGQRYRGGY